MLKPNVPKTHFEQIPLEVVKQIPGVDIQVGEARQAEAPVKPAAKRPLRGRGHLADCEPAVRW